LLHEVTEEQGSIDRCRDLYQQLAADMDAYDAACNKAKGIYLHHLPSLTLQLDYLLTEVRTAVQILCRHARTW
jgi:hypothetical protein